MESLRLEAKTEGCHQKAWNTLGRGTKRTQTTGWWCWARHWGEQHSRRSSLQNVCGQRKHFWTNCRSSKTCIALGFCFLSRPFYVRTTRFGSCHLLCLKCIRSNTTPQSGPRFASFSVLGTLAKTMQPTTSQRFQDGTAAWDFAQPRELQQLRIGHLGSTLYRCSVPRRRCSVLGSCANWKTGETPRACKNLRYVRPNSKVQVRMACRLGRKRRKALGLLNSTTDSTLLTLTAAGNTTHPLLQKTFS